MASTVSRSRQSSRPRSERQRAAARRTSPSEALSAEEQRRLAALLRGNAPQWPAQITQALAGQIGNRAVGQLTSASHVQRQASEAEDELPEAGEPATQEVTEALPSSDLEEFAPDEGSLAAALAMVGRPPERRNMAGPPKAGQVSRPDQFVQNPPIKAPGLEGGVKSGLGALAAGAAGMAGAEAGALAVGATAEAAGTAPTAVGAEPTVAGAAPTAAPEKAGLETAGAAPAITKPAIAGAIAMGEATSAGSTEGAGGAVEPGRAAGAAVDGEREAAGGEESASPAGAEAVGKTPSVGVATAGASQGRDVRQQTSSQVASQAEAADSEQAGREESQAREAGEEARHEAQAEEAEHATPGPSTGPEALAPPEGGAGDAARERAEALAARVRSLVERGAQLLAQGARGVISFLSGMVGGPAAAVARAISAIADFASRTVSQVGRAIRSVVGPIMRIISTVASTALGYLQRAYGSLRDAVGRLIPGAGRLIEEARERGRALARRMYQGVVGLVRQARTAATTAVRTAVQSLVRVMSQAANAARSGIHNLAARVRQGIAAARQRVRAFLDTALGGESPLAPRYAARVRQRLRQIARQRLVRLPEIMARVRLATVVPLLTIVGSIGNAVRTVWNSVRETFREVFAEPVRTVQEHAPEIAAEVQLGVGDGETLAAELEAAAQQELAATETALIEVEGELRVEAEVTGETL